MLFFLTKLEARVSNYGKILLPLGLMLVALSTTAGAFNTAQTAASTSGFIYSYPFYPNGYPIYRAYPGYPPFYYAPPDHAQANTESPPSDRKSPPLPPNTPLLRQNDPLYPPATYRAPSSKSWLEHDIPWRGAPPPGAH
jgi:hypothetical protein